MKLWVTSQWCTLRESPVNNLQTDIRFASLPSARFEYRGAGAFLMKGQPNQIICRFQFFSRGRFKMLCGIAIVAYFSFPLPFFLQTPSGPRCDSYSESVSTLAGTYHVSAWARLIFVLQSSWAICRDKLDCFSLVWFMFAIGLVTIPWHKPSPNY